MSHPTITIAVFLTLSVCAWSEAQTPKSGPTSRSKPALAAAGPIDIGGFTLTPPKEWKSRKPVSSMRKAEFIMPRAKGDTEDGMTIVYFFGAGGAGGADANLARWSGQVERESDTSEADAKRRLHKTVHGMKITIIELRGTYTEQRFGPGPKPRPKPKHMMLAAVIESPKGAYYVKTTGPQKTIRKWYKSWNAALDALEPTKKAK